MVACDRRYGVVLVVSNCTSKSPKSRTWTAELSIRQYVVRDVTSRRAREAALAHRAEHDSLTGLVNRARFQARLAEMLSPRAVPVEPADARKAAVLFIDLDGFKPINDRAGHAAGDAVLVAVGRVSANRRAEPIWSRASAATNSPC